MTVSTTTTRIASVTPPTTRRARCVTRRTRGTRRDDVATTTHDAASQSSSSSSSSSTWISAVTATIATSPARAEGISDVGIDAAPDPVVAAAFALAVVLLVVCTGGMGYIAFREALDRAEETKAREEEARQERVVAANKGKFTAAAGKVKTAKMTPSQIAAAAAAGEDGAGAMNRRERRRLERAAAVEEE